MSTPPRKVPLPCWTHDETLALIDAYRDKWYCLHRGNLRATDWDAVAIAVARRCHLISPPKTSVQCRHKIEKLRKRYRTEKHRCLAYPGRFFSSWVFFPNMDSMENGPSTAVGSNRDTNARGGFRVKTLLDRNSVLGSKNYGTINWNSNSNFDFDHDAIGRFRAKSLTDSNFVPVGSVMKHYRKVDGKSSPNFDIHGNVGADIDVAGGFCGKTPVNRNLISPGLKSKNYIKIDGDYNSNFEFDHDANDVTVTPVDWNSVPPGFSSKNRGKVDSNYSPKFDSRAMKGCSSAVGSGYNADDRIDAIDKFHVKTPADQNFVPPGKSYGKVNGNSKPIGKRSGGGSGGSVKKEMNPVGEMISAIKLLGEGFVKMEKMKMEMAREMEKMRMEMEMKRIEMIVESQQQIVDAFVTGILEKKKKKMKVVLPDSLMEQ